MQVRKQLNIVVFTLFVFLMLLTFGVVAQESVVELEHTGLRPDAPTYAIWGEYWVGTMEMVIEDDDRPVSVTVWYPALNEEGSEDYAVYDMGVTDMLEEGSLIHGGHALADASAALTDAPYPLVVVSHALGASRFGYHRLSEHLASNGFVVVNVEHIGTATKDFFEGVADVGSDNVILSLYYRPSDIVRVIDFADQMTADGGELEGMIDTEHVAVWGHSTGGTTVLQAGGARIDFDALSVWCADKEDDEYAAESCQFLGHEDEIATLYGVDADEGDLLPALWDARVDAVVAAAPGGELHAFGDSGLAEVQVPVMLMYGTDDHVVLPEYNTLWAYEQISNDTKAVIAFGSGDHMIFYDCPAVFAEFCGYDAVWDLDRVDDLINHLTTAFLLDVLKGDEEAHTALMLENVAFPGITYETTMK